LDLSQLLIRKENDLVFEYQNNKMKILPIENFKFKLSFDKELLSKELKH
jgi:hypothetical protein